MQREEKTHIPMVDSDSTLSCQETQTCFNDEEEKHGDLYVFEHPSDKERKEDDEYVQILLRRELAIKSCHMTGNWIERARLDSIQWILNTSALFGFQLQTGYLSVTYFDRFLSRRIIDNEKYWAVRLLSMACLSLAAKMEELKVPLLTYFPMEDYNFEGKVIQRMELLVLNTLEWKISSVTPFDYLYYFISNFCNQSQSRNVVPIIIELIYATILDIDFMNYRPSVITAAATLLAAGQKQTKQCLELKLSTFYREFLEIEDVFSCYNRMQELDRGKIKLPRHILSPNLSPVQLKEADVFGNSSVSSAVSNKRKRLKFNDSDQTYETPEEMRSD